MSPVAEVMDMISPAEVQATADAAKVAALAFVEDNKILVVDRSSCQRAVTLRQHIAVKRGDVVTKLAGPKSWAFKLHRWFCDLESAAVAPYDQLDTFEQKQIKDWNDEQSRIARERERELAEQQRQEEETRALAEAAALEQAALSAPTREVAVELEQQAEAVMKEALAASRPVVVVQSEARQVVGLKTRRDWKWRFTGGDATRAFPKIPREYLCVDTKKIDKVVKAMQGSTAIPGIETYFDDVPVR